MFQQSSFVPQARAAHFEQFFVGPLDECAGAVADLVETGAVEPLRLERHAVDFREMGDFLGAFEARLVRHDQQRDVDRVAVVRPFAILVTDMIFTYFMNPFQT